MASRILYFAGFLFLVLSWSGPVRSDEPATSEDVEKEESAADVAAAATRTPAEADKDFTQDYLDRVNTAQQASDQQRVLDRQRHDKLLEYYMKH